LLRRTFTYFAIDVDSRRVVTLGKGFPSAASTKHQNRSHSHSQNLSPAAFEK
jgi:hypothetical protein